MCDCLSLDDGGMYLCEIHAQEYKELLNLYKHDDDKHKFDPDDEDIPF